MPWWGIVLCVGGGLLALFIGLFVWCCAVVAGMTEEIRGDE